MATRIFDLKRQREEQDHELKMVKAELKNDIDAAEIEQDRKDDLTTMAMRYVRKAGIDGYTGRENGPTKTDRNSAGSTLMSAAKKDGPARQRAGPSSFSG